jgi:hypothetical protein
MKKLDIYQFETETTIKYVEFETFEEAVEYFRINSGTELDDVIAASDCKRFPDTIFVSKGLTFVIYECAYRPYGCQIVSTHVGCEHVTQLLEKVLSLQSFRIIRSEKQRIYV